MSEALPSLHRPATGPPWILVLLGSMIALSLGMAVGHPSTLWTMVVVGLVGIAIGTRVAQHPFEGFLVLSGTVVFLIVYAINDDRYLNAFDLLMPVMFLASALGTARREADARDALQTGVEHRDLRSATRTFYRASILYFSLCLISLINILIRIGAPQAMESLFGIARSIEGTLMFPLGIWWLRTERNLRSTITALLTAGVVFGIVNAYQIFGRGAFRAGITWVVNHPEWTPESANEAGATMVILFALILGMHQLRPRWYTYPVLAAITFMLVLTQSRSGLLALVTFVLFGLRGIRWQYLAVGGLFVAAAVALAPPEYYQRVARSVTLERGSFEAYTILIRFYGYETALRIFQENWLFGVGYLSCRYISEHYNDLSLASLNPENLFLETAAGLGVIGLAVLAYWYVALFKLGNTVKRLAPPGSLAHMLARFHIPLMVALSVANLSAVNFMGLVGAGQLALWCALLVRAGHIAIDGARPAAVARARPSDIE